MNKLISLVGMQLLPEIPKKSCMTLKRFDKTFTIRSLSVFLPVLMQNR
jgi:hypothetical protein